MNRKCGKPHSLHSVSFNLCRKTGYRSDSHLLGRTEMRKNEVMFPSLRKYKSRCRVKRQVHALSSSFISVYYNYLRGRVACAKLLLLGVSCRVTGVCLTGFPIFQLNQINELSSGIFIYFMIKVIFLEKLSVGKLKDRKITNCLYRRWKR